MNQEIVSRVKRWVKALIPVLGFAVAALVGLKLAVYFIPFIVAFILANLMEPMILFFQRKLHISRKPAAALSIVILFSVLAFLLLLAITRLITELIHISVDLPRLFNETYQNLDTLIRNTSEMYIGLSPDITKQVEAFISGCWTYIFKVINGFVKTIFQTAISLPEALVFIVVTILSTYFIASDKDKIYSYIQKTLPAALMRRIQRVKDEVFSTLIGYLKAQLILMVITFSELFIGFLIIGIESPLILAMIISFIDALPILGTGSVLIPWLAYEFLIGNTQMGFSLVVLYLVVLLVRQLTEPKILSRQIGMHPLLTLVAMYVGLKLFGILGMILGPIVVMVLKNLLSGMFKNTSLKQVLKQKGLSP